MLCKALLSVGFSERLCCSLPEQRFACSELRGASLPAVLARGSGWSSAWVDVSSAPFPPLEAVSHWMKASEAQQNSLLCLLSSTQGALRWGTRPEMDWTSQICSKNDIDTEKFVFQTPRHVSSGSWPRGRILSGVFD